MDHSIGAASFLAYALGMRVFFSNGAFPLILTSAMENNLWSLTFLSLRLFKSFKLIRINWEIGIEEEVSLAREILLKAKSQDPEVLDEIKKVDFATF